MSSRAGYTIVGLFVGIIVDLLVNLIAAAIQQRVFVDQFSNQSIWWLVGAAIAFALVGFWLGEKVPAPAAAQGTTLPAEKKSKNLVTVTRLQAWFSKAKLRGKGIHVKDTSLYGSEIDIDSRE